MAYTITFRVGDIRELVEHSRASKQHRPCYADAYEAKYHRDGVLKYQPGSEFPDMGNLDETRIPASLLLVGDRVYCLSNGLPRLPSADGR